MTRQAARTLWPAVIALVGAVGLVLATPHGIGLSPDSISYVGGARSIVDGRGFTTPVSGEPITHYAPFYSVLLATTALFGPNPVQGARWLAAVLFGLNILLLWRLASRTATEVGSTAAWVPAAIASLAVTAPAMWGIHLMAWTEPAYIALCLAGLGLAARYLGSSNPIWLIGAGASIGLATMTRYAGVSMAGACALGLVWFGRKPFTRRIADAALFSALCLGPLAFWAGRNLLSAGTATDRSVAFHPIGRDHLNQALSTVASWLLVPAHAPGWAKIAVIGAVAAALVVGICLRLRVTGGITAGRLVETTPDVVKMTLVATIVYPLFLAASISIVDANTPLDQRILSPLFVLLLILAAFGLQSWDVVIGMRRRRRALALLVICLVCVAYSRVSYPLIARSSREGLGFNNRRWADSSLVQAIRGLPSSALIYSNSPEAVYYHAGRAATRIPNAFSAVTRSANPDYPREMAVMSRELKKGAVLVYFNLGAAGRVSDLKDLIRDLGLIQVRSFPDGAIYARQADDPEGASRATTAVSRRRASYWGESSTSTPGWARSDARLPCTVSGGRWMSRRTRTGGGLPPFKSPGRRCA